MNTQYLQVNDGKIAYDDTGSGPLVVCVPGMGDLRGEYRFLAPQLVEAGYRVVTMDVRGHGETSPSWPDASIPAIGRDILALINHLDAGPAVLLGNSFSAGSAAWAAVEAPEKIRALVMLGPAVRGEVPPTMRLLYKALFARPWGPAAWLMYFKTLYPTRKPDDFDEYTARLKRNLSQPGRLEMLLGLMLASKKPGEERLARVSVPTLVIMGSKDPDFKDPRAEADWVAAQVKGECHVIEGAGHYPYAEMPEITAPLILDFLDAVVKEADLAASAR